MRRPWPTGGLLHKLKKNCLVGLTKTTVEQSTSGFKFKHGKSLNTKCQISSVTFEVNNIVLPFYMAFEIRYTQDMMWIQHGVSPIVCVCVCVICVDTRAETVSLGMIIRLVCT